MGRKKRKSVRPWCWYCNREFDDEAVLIQEWFKILLNKY